MSDKKTLMTCEAKDFVAAMNPKKEATRKSSPNCRSVKNHHAKGR